MMNSTRSESLKVYLTSKYGAQSQRTISVYGKGVENNCVGDLDFFRVIFNQVFYRKGVRTIK